MNKRLVIFGVLLAALLLSAVSPWPATLWVWNFTGDNIYFTLKYRGVQKYFLTATPEGNSPRYYLSTFDIERRQYSAQVTACETTTTWGRMNMLTNLRLTFTPCESMRQFWTPKYWGEPTMEKPNFWNWAYWTKTTRGNFWQHVPENDPHYGALYGWYRFRFLYDVAPAGTCWNDSKPWPAVPDYCY
ncbi:MAG: hypothetical protein ACOY16_06625 [Chloroflexota bacterium]